MKGVVLAGGSGTRLLPLTKIANKHLLPVYDKSMVMYPLNTLIDAGIRDIMIVSGRGHAGQFLELLGSGEDLILEKWTDFGVKLSYSVQEKAGGIAEALGLCKRFVRGDDDVAVILGDNVFEDKFNFNDFGKKGEKARVYFKAVPDPENFGVPKFDMSGSLIDIIEKPKRGESPSDLAQTGLYLYDNSVFDIISELVPSLRGELEITDVNRAYLKMRKLDFRIVRGAWIDAGTSFESLYEASTFVRSKRDKEQEG
jgi:glucose-1-phosphate thymidylyltransferase